MAKTERFFGLSSTEVIDNFETINRRVGGGSGNGQEHGRLLQREGDSTRRSEQEQHRCFWSENSLFVMPMAKSMEGNLGDGTSFLKSAKREH